ncbi:MAG: hypothetical protein J5I41_09225 [Saprospiraceae bacterium]|nr:hypothetical protein [Saprospiraceae bacterium]
MKSPSYFSLFLVLFPALLGAQEAEPVILLSATGKVIYQPPGEGKVIPVYAGALLLPDGKVAVKGKGTATLQFKKSLKKINNRSLQVIADLMGDGYRSLGFPGTFAEQVEEAFVMAYFSPEDSPLPWSTMRRQKGMGDGWGIKGDTRDTSATVQPGTPGDGWTIKGDTRDTSARVQPGTPGDGWTIKGDTRDTSARVQPGTPGDGWTIKGDTRDTSARVQTGNPGDGWGIKGDTRDTSATVQPGTPGDGWGIKGDTRDTSATVQPGTPGDGWGIKGGTRDTSATVQPGTPGDGWAIKGDTRDTNATVQPGTPGDGWGIKGDTRDTSATVQPGTPGDGFGIKGDTRDTSATVKTGNPGDGFGIKGDTRDTSGTVRTGSPGDGFGKTRISSLHAYNPYGYVSPGTVTFYWSVQGEGSVTYVVEVLHPDGRPLAKGTTTGSSLTLVLPSSAFVPETIYTWRVRIPGNPPLVSNSLQLAAGLPADRAEILDRVTGSQLYTSAAPDVQALMRAVAFEKAEWFGNAVQAYEEAIRLQGRNGKSARLMLAAFWERQSVREQSIRAFPVR